MWRSLVAWVRRRRPGVGPGDRVFGYADAILPVLWTFVVLSAVELVAVHLVIPWPGVRLVLDVLGIWGLIWMLGMVGSVRTLPHVVGPEGVRIRNGMSVDILVPWDTIATASTGRHSPTGSRAVQFSADGSTLDLVVGGQTTVDLRLTGPTTIVVRSQPATVTRVRFHADDPKAMARAIRDQLHSEPRLAAGPATPTEDGGRGGSSAG